MEKSIVSLPRIATHVTFFGFLVILPLYFFAPFFCCPCHVSLCMCSFEHMSLPDWQISTPHLISLHLMIRTLLSLPESSPRYSHFLNLIFLFLNLLHVTLYSSIFSFSLFLFLFLNLLLIFLSFIFLFLTFSSLVRSGLLSAFEHPVTIVHSTLYALQ